MYPRYAPMWGVSLLDNPSVYNADPSRLVDYRNLSLFLNSSTAGYQFPMPGNNAQAVYQGFQFLSGEQAQVISLSCARVSCLECVMGVTSMVPSMSAFIAKASQSVLNL